MEAPERTMKGALAGVRVLEVGTLLAGPFCGRLLADMGAEVIKVEPPDAGDPMRVWGRLKDGRSPWWAVQSRNKKCVTLNLRTERGQAIFRDLAARSDVLIENFRPGTMERWRLGYEELSQTNPRLIMVRASGFGQTGPYRHRAGFGSVAEAMGGLRHITGYPDRPPVRVGISIGDSLAGLFGALGAQAALYHREAHSGRGQVVDVAIYEAVFAMMESLIPEYDLFGYVRERTGNILPGVAPSNTYPTKEESWVIIGANGDGVFKRLAEAMGQPELATSEEYATHVARGQRQAELDGIIAAWTAQHTVDEIVALLDRAGVPAGKIYTAADIVADPQYLAREMLLEVTDKHFGRMTIPGFVPKLSESPGKLGWTGPELGEHNHEVYTGLLELTLAQLEELRSAKVI